MEKNIERTSVVNTSASLEGDENKVVDFNGELISVAGTGCYGVVSMGRPQDAASEIVKGGSYDVNVDGTTATGNGNIVVNDPLTAGGGNANGQMTLASIGTHPIRAYAQEAATTETTIKVYFT